jgi:hypothetical protein
MHYQLTTRTEPKYKEPSRFLRLAAGSKRRNYRVNQGIYNKAEKPLGITRLKNANRCKAQHAKEKKVMTNITLIARMKSK